MKLLTIIIMFSFPLFKINFNFILSSTSIFHLLSGKIIYGYISHFMHVKKFQLAEDSVQWQGFVNKAMHPSYSTKVRNSMAS
jgi:hypothetical protein